MSATGIFFIALGSLIVGFLLAWYAQSRKLSQYQPTPEVEGMKLSTMERGEVNPRIVRTLHDDCICGAKPNQWCFTGCAALDPWDYR